MLNHYCMICADKKSAAMALSDAQRIVMHIRRHINYVSHKGYDLDAVPKKSRFVRRGDEMDLCYSHQHIMCGSCPEINSKMNEVHRIEKEISAKVISIHYLMLEVKDTDKEVFGYLKTRLMPLLSGHYPKAARLISIT